MAFPWTLQKYIFREMAKTFILAGVALTAVLSLGGGLLQMLRLGEVTLVQLLQLMALVVPMVGVLTLPIAALFCATATYGRLSADNEFVACSSSGINLHVLLLPTVVLSLLTASVTFCFTNFVVPQMVKNLHAFVLEDTEGWIRQQLKSPKGIKLPGNYRVHVADDAVRMDQSDQVTLRKVAFAEFDDGEWKSLGTMQELVLRFEREEGRTYLRGVPRGVYYYDVKRGRVSRTSEQPFRIDEIPLFLPRKIKFLDLGELLHYLNYVGEWGPVRDAVEELRAQVGRAAACDALWDDWSEDHRLELDDGTLRLVIESQDGVRHSGDQGIELTDVSVEEHRPGSIRRSTARRLIVSAAETRELADSEIRLTAYEVVLIDAVSKDLLEKRVYDPMPLPPQVVTSMEGMSAQTLFAVPAGRQEVAAGAASDDPFARKREAARELHGRTHRRIIATINERLAISISVLALVLFGAGVSIILRGSHVVSAFGIGFVPSLLVFITIVMGKQMSENDPTHLAGLIVMWSGMGIVGILDLVTLGFVLRR